MHAYLYQQEVSQWTSQLMLCLCYVASNQLV